MHLLRGFRIAGGHLYVFLCGLCIAGWPFVCIFTWHSHSCGGAFVCICMRYSHSWGAILYVFLGGIRIAEGPFVCVFMWYLNSWGAICVDFYVVFSYLGQFVCIFMWYSHSWWHDSNSESGPAPSHSRSS